MQGTWCDALTVQAVAESLNVQIYIVESHANLDSYFDTATSFITAATKNNIYRSC